jgi:hypothetical protein
MTSIDTNIDNYTVSELLTILDIDQPSDENVTETTSKFIDRFTNENRPEMVTFFLDMQSKLLHYVDELETSDKPAEYGPAKTQTDNWWANQALKQDSPVQNDKITERKQKIDVYNDNHLPMNREQLGINNVKLVDVAQDSLNPNLENITTRLINIDSQYRQSSVSTDISTDFTMDLSEPLTNTLSLKLYSFQIPFSWYAIDSFNGTNCFWIVFTDDSGNIIYSPNSNGISSPGINISIESGNYDNNSFAVAINAAFSTAGFSFTTLTPVTISSASGKMTMNLYNASYTNPSFPGSPIAITDTNTNIVFFDPTATLICSTGCVQQLAINQTMGWLMGYRLPFVPVDPSGNIGPAVVDLYGPKYLILAIDDYNQNHINNGLIGISEPSRTLKLPSYYSPDMPYTCSKPSPLTAASIIKSTTTTSGIAYADKMTALYSPTQQILPSAPRTLTQSQIYSINEILKNNEKTYNYRLTSPTTTDTFALIPVKGGGLKTGDVYVDFGGTLQENNRVYFGPVNIERMRVTLYNDKGQILNLNGLDWSITLMSENLYQY